MQQPAGREDKPQRMQQHAGSAVQLQQQEQQQRDRRVLHEVAMNPDGPGQRLDAAVSEADLQDLCGRHLARYKVPDSITFVGGFERTPMGKIRKTVLRESLSR